MKKVLFVCSGNTCRSPMAMEVFNDIVSKKSIDALAFSAGLYTTDGLDYSENSIKALKEEGISAEGKSKQLTADMLKDADYIFGMTSAIGSDIIMMFPEYSEKVYRFPAEVTDPFGGDIGMYKICLSKIIAGTEKIADAINSGEI